MTLKLTIKVDASFCDSEDVLNVILVTLAMNVAGYTNKAYRYLPCR
ncbi:MAG: hypothetical protein AAGA75_05555 [Cyanobacteria bacterium P01_E01_bin.6]